jgi:hypothetical protein
MKRMFGLLEGFFVSAAPSGTAERVKAMRMSKRW